MREIYTKMFKILVLFFTICSYSQNPEEFSPKSLSDKQIKTKINQLNKEKYIKNQKYVFIPNKIFVDNDTIKKQGFFSAMPNEFDLEGSYSLLGKKLPDYNLERQTGGNFSSNQLIDKPTIINFWFTECHPCLEEIPVLNYLKEKYGDKINTIAITFEDRAKVLNYDKKFHFQFERLINADKYITQIGITSFPKIILLDKNNIVRYIPISIYSSQNEKTSEILLKLFEMEIESLINE